MFLDLTHNRIVEKTMTQNFIAALEERLIPVLQDKYGASLDGVQMYEDYIGDKFVYNGEWYYPLTVVLKGDRVTEWIKWRYVGNGDFEEGIPYAYVGAHPLNIKLADAVPEPFAEKLAGRNTYFDNNAVHIDVEAIAKAPTFLCGKYSQMFVDEMARQLTYQIERAFSVTGLSASGIDLKMIFAPGTYMEYTSGSVTYRRLIMTDGARTLRDFWVKWERLDGRGAFSACDHVTAADIRFDIGEDVPQKFREKEYRFMLREDAEKYRRAMGRRTLTDWRDILKRAIKRGVLFRVITSDDATATPQPIEKPPAYDTPALDLSMPSAPKKPRPVAPSAPAAHDRADDAEQTDVLSKLAKLVHGENAAPEVEQPTVDDEEFERAVSVARAAVAMQKEPEPTTPTEAVDMEAEREKIRREIAERAERELSEREQEMRRKIEEQLRREFEAREVQKMREDALRAAEESRADEENRRIEEERRAKEQAALAEAARRHEQEVLRIEEERRRLQEATERLREERLRAEEAIRMEQERKQKADAEAALREQEARAEQMRLEEERLRREEAARAEQLRMAEQVRLEAERLANEERLRREEEERVRRAEKERLRREEEERLRREEEERIRRAEEERLRREEEERLRREEEERLRREEEERLRREEEERLRREEEERIRRAEEERLRREEEERLRREEEERIRREEARRLEEEAARLEAARRAAEEAARIESERLQSAREKAANLERERLEAEQVARKHAEELKRLEEERRSAEQKRLEAEQLLKQTTATDVFGDPKVGGYTYTSKKVHILFRHDVDPNINKRIHAIMTDTIAYFNKQDVYISVRASISSRTSVDLDFVRIPVEENELLINIIKVLGNSDLGIAKIILD